MQLTLVAIGKNEAHVASFDRTHIGDAELVLIANVSHEPLSRIANRHLEHSRDVFGLCHTNAVFGSGSLEIFTKVAMEGKICGIVGSHPTTGYHWCDSSPGKVSTLDGCAVFFLVKSGLRFDDVTFNGFHCHVPDLCLQAQKKGMEIVVPAANASHADSDHTPSESEVWNRDYWRYVGILRNKWKGTNFSVT